MNEKLTYTIFADIGDAPWAWVKPFNDKTTWVGGNCANGSNWYGYHCISKKLESDFAKWAVYFESQNFYLSEDNSDFDWQAFHRRGWELCTILKVEIGNKARVCYVKASEDPHRESIVFEFLLDGSMKTFIPEKHHQI